jgi:hypothetical protein
LKNQVHAVLHQRGVRAPVTDVFGRAGRQWLTQVKLPAQDRESIKRVLPLDRPVWPGDRKTKSPIKGKGAGR